MTFAQSYLELKRAEEDIFEIIFHQSFDESTPGIYIFEEWQRDWNYAKYTNGVDKTEIIEMDGNRIMKFNYPLGSRGPSEGGGQWLSNFGSGHDEVYFTWNMMFKPGFEWVLGGKLPGLGGGDNPGGGKTVAWDSGFSARIMFDRETRPEGKMFFYVYHQDKTHAYGDIFGFGDKALLDVSDSIWYNMTIRIVMNSIDSDKLVTDPENAGYKNGLMEFFFDGKLVYSKTGMRFRNLRSIWVDTQHVTSFFGGGSDEWRNTRVEWLLLDDFYVYTYKDGVDVPRMRTPSPSGRVIEVPNLKIAQPDPTDTEPPTVPSGLAVTGATGISIGLNWNPSTDNVFLKGYRVFVNGDEVGTTINNSYTVTGLESNTAYSFSVTAYDGSGNESAQSVAISGSTVDPDLESPSTPTDLHSTVTTENSITIEWNGSTDNIGVVGYQLYLNGGKVGTTVSTLYSILGLDASTEYNITVSAFDASNNESTQTPPLTIATRAPDATTPTTPDGLEAILVTQNTISLAWNNSSDNVAVAGYYVKVNNLRKGTAISNSYTITGLDPGIDYAITVSAFDHILNESSESDVLLAKTKNPDITSTPTLPDISIKEVNNLSNAAQTVTILNSFGYAELKDYGVQVTKENAAVKFDTIIFALPEGSEVKQTGRVNSDLLLMYDFSEGAGDQVLDVSGNSDPINLLINDPLSVSWLPGRGLRIDGETVIAHPSVPGRLINVLKSTNEITLETWIKPSAINQSGPARIVTLSKDNSNQAVTLGHSGNNASFNYKARLNTSTTDENGIPEVSTSEDFISLNLQHVVYTRNRAGLEKIYVNGEERYSGNRSGDFSSWTDDYYFVIANELSGERPWDGTFYLIAIFNRALDQEEVDKNFSAGLGEIEFTTDIELESNVSYSLTPFVRTVQGNVFGQSRSFMIENVRIDDSDLEEATDTLLVAVYPNPTPGVFNVEFEDKGEESNSAIIRIADQSGQVFFNKQINLPTGTFGGVERLDISSLLRGKGIYFVIVIMGSKSAARKLIIV